MTRAEEDVIAQIAEPALSAGRFLIFTDAHDEGQVTAINQRHIAAVRSGPEIASLGGDDYGSCFVIMPDGGTYHVRGYFRDIVDTLAQQGVPHDES